MRWTGTAPLILLLSVGCAIPSDPGETTEQVLDRGSSGGVVAGADTVDFNGEALVVPASPPVDPSLIEEAVASLHRVDWRLHEITVSPVESIELPYGPD